MKNIFLLLTPNVLKNFTKLAFRSSCFLATLFALSGCLLTSPFWNQEFASHTSKVPLQAWTTKKSKPIKFECSKAYHGGLYPVFSSGVWHTVATVNPSQNPSFDPLGGTIYSASRNAALPLFCWRQDPGNNVWYSAIRATQDGKTYNIFDKAGLECLGREDGKATSWFGWIAPKCAKTYSNSNNNIPYVVFRAKP